MLKPSLSPDERKRLYILLTEAKSRGLAVPVSVSNISAKDEWNVDENGYFIRADGQHYEPSEKQGDFINSTSRFSLYYGPRGCGKALALYTPIPTPFGWKYMGDLRQGDYVFDENGAPTQVVSVSDVMYGRKCYGIEFMDGTTIIADEAHEWSVLTYLDRKRSGKHTIKTTREMAKDYIKDGYGGYPVYKYSVSMCDPVNYIEKKLPIHPYVLGAWLGDGSSRDSTITIGVDDREMVDIIESFGYPLHNSTDKFTWSFGKRGGDAGFRKSLQSLGVWKKQTYPR